ncbi:bifunctional pyr operon transcriptional regulator/uracil phosphoribosyltransferase PyrR [bacterium]|nr:bifunctional pyr operon transcriptional regulator/uracil phosphoribosyltransferase PyrR [bacterium]
MNEDKHRRLIMTEDDITRTLHRMAHQVWEKSKADNLVLVGILKHGVPLARRIKSIIDQVSGKDIPLGTLDIGLYRDDIGRSNIAQPLRSTEIPFDVEGKDVVLVDDVIYTGRTVRSALNALIDLGRPSRVQLLALIDRGHRELPIQADFIGQQIKTYEKETVQVFLREEDGMEGVFIDLNLD